MKNSIIAFLAGALSTLLLFLKIKKPDVITVSGDLIENQKVKDNSKRKGLFGFLKPDPVKKMERQNRATDRRMKRLEARALRKKK